MTWEQAAQMAQVVSTIILGIGIMVSLWIGIRTTREAQANRLQSVRPELYFDPGGQYVRCEEVARGGIPRLDGRKVQKILKDRPETAKRIDAEGQWGGLTNHGTGSALNSEITIITRAVHVKGERREISESDLRRFPFHPVLNCIPSMPANIPAERSGFFRRLPTPIVCDYDKKIEQLEAVCLITYQDVFENKYYRAQELKVIVDRSRDELAVIMTFGSELKDDADSVKASIEQFTPCSLSCEHSISSGSQFVWTFSRSRIRPCSKKGVSNRSPNGAPAKFRMSGRR
ncbi:MAG: hypothetical protein ACOC9Q_02375 [bacterium]